jgi:glycosyltransferase involved in cell wall biosynthesis
MVRNRAADSRSASRFRQMSLQHYDSPPMTRDGFPRITVVTPSLNQGQFLEQAIESVLNQGYPNLEYILVDGGSSDGSRAIIEKYAQRFTWWVSEKDAGQSDALNKGFRRATGTILAWLNSDDCYCPGALHAVASYFLEHPDVGLVMGDCDTIDEAGRIVDTTKAVRVDYNTMLYTCCAVAQPAVFFTIDAYRRTGEVDTGLQFQMYFEYFLRMRWNGIKFGIIKKPLAQFRLHGTSKTIMHYAGAVHAANLIVQRRFLDHSGKSFKGIHNRQLLLFLYRMKLYLWRLLTRGCLMPFSSTFVRNRVLRAQSGKQ